MRLEAINLGRRETISLGRHTVDTGIDKRPVERATIGLLEVEGDVIASEKHHGGPDQAVYLYSRSDYDWWEGELERALAAGTFGENLTIPAVGDNVELIPLTGGLTLLDHFRLHYDKSAPVAAIEEALAAPIAIRERADLEKRLRRLVSA